MSLLDDLLRNAEESATLINQERDKIEGQLTTYRIPEGTTRICDNCFSASNLSEIIIPNTVTEIGILAFAGCENLTDIVLPNALTILGGFAFQYCGSLTALSIPDSVTFLGEEVFAYCRSLLTLTLPNSLTSIRKYTFRDCQAITTINIPNSVASIGEGAFVDCFALTTLTIPNSVTIIGDYAFGYCRSLTDVTLGNGFNCNGLNLSSSTLYSAETIVSWLNALADRTGDTAYTLTIGSTNLAKLTAEQIAIAINKNWNLA